jgi:tripartite-type tricarboxylate transporter receptor subunit TctC
MTISRKKAFLLFAGAATLAAGAVPASADAVSDFYKGRTVTVQVPSSLGATLGLYGRLVVDHIGKHIPGSPTVVIESRPGAGGAVGAAYAFNVAPKDGSYISEVLSAIIVDSIVRPNGKFNAGKFQWIGSVATRPAVISVWAATTPAKTLAEAEKIQVIMGSSGKSSETYMMPTLMNALLGTRFKVVLGYKGGAEINQAMEQGEIHGRMQYWSGWTAGKPDWLRDHKLIHFVQYGPVIKDIPAVPRLVDMVKEPKQKQMVSLMEASNHVGMGFWVPPGVPRDRLTALRNAFESMLRDDTFLAAAKKLKAPVEPMKGSELQKIVEAAYATPPAMVEELKKIIAGDGKS